MNWFKGANNQIVMSGETFVLKKSATSMQPVLQEI
jgi:hypothetical protein